MLNTEPLKPRQEEITYLQGLLLESVRRENSLKSDLAQANWRIKDLEEDLQNAYERIDDLEFALSESLYDLERACMF